MARSLGLLGDRWTLLVVRDALLGSSRFADFQTSLGVAPDILTVRLSTLVEYGILTKKPYREAGSRTRYGYHLTDAGRALGVVVASLQDWGDAHLPSAAEPPVRRRTKSGGRVYTAFVDDTGHVLHPRDIVVERTV